MSDNSFAIAAVAFELPPHRARHLVQYPFRM